MENVMFFCTVLSLASKLYNDDSSAMNFHDSEAVPFLHSIMPSKIRDEAEPGLHKLWYPGIRDRSTWGKFGAHGEHGDVFLFSNLGAL